MYQFEIIELGKGGIAPCVRCSSSAPVPHKKDSVIDSLINIKALLSAETEKLSAVVLTGFEPFAHPGLVEVLRHPALSAVERIMLTTDGGALSSVQNVFGTLDSGVSVYEIVLRGSHADSHDSYTARPGLFNAAMQGVTQLRAVSNERDQHIFVTAVIDICKHNAHEFLSIVEAALKAGVDAIRIQDSDKLIAPGFIKAAHEMATSSSVLLFGEGQDSITEPPLYRFLTRNVQVNHV